MEHSYNQVNKITDSLNVLLNLVPDLNYIQKEELDINVCMEIVLNMFHKKESNILFVKKLDYNIPRINCYKHEFLMMLYNLIINAIHAIRAKENPKGQILVSTDLDLKEQKILIKIK